MFLETETPGQQQRIRRREQYPDDKSIRSLQPVEKRARKGEMKQPGQIVPTDMTEENIFFQEEESVYNPNMHVRGGGRTRALKVQAMCKKETISKTSDPHKNGDGRGPRITETK